MGLKKHYINIGRFKILLKSYDKSIKCKRNGRITVQNHGYCDIIQRLISDIYVHSVSTKASN